LGTSVVAQALRRLRGVEVDVPAFLLHDAPQHLGENGMVTSLGESGVAGLGRPFVDGSPRHVDRGHRRADRHRRQPVDERLGRFRGASRATQLAHACCAGGLAVRS